MVSAAPPGRAYERVSTPDLFAGVVPGLGTTSSALPGRSSNDGDRMIFGASSTMGSNWSGPPNPMIFAERTETGWRVRSAIRSMDEGNTPLEFPRHEPRAGWLSHDGREYVFGTSFLDSSAIGFGVYRSPNALEPPRWLSGPSRGGVIAGSVTAGGDTRTVAFNATAPNTEDAPPMGTRAVYVHRDGELRLASVDPAGEPFTQRMSLANSGSGQANRAIALELRNQVAGNGRFVLMMQADSENEFGSGGLRPLYVRDLDAGVTRRLAGPGTDIPGAELLSDGWGGALNPFGTAVSFSLITVPAGRVFGARDAPRAFFHSTAGMGSTPFVYDANLETGEVTARPAITGPPLQLSADGEHMLFLEPPADGVDREPRGNYTLRYWSAANPNSSVAIGTIAYPEGDPARTYGLARVHRSSPDGRTWIFSASGSPDPARPNVAPRTLQLYRWTVGEATPTCLTCRPTDGIARTSGVNLTVQETEFSENLLTPTTTTQSSGAVGLHKSMLAQPGHSLSDDGRWLLFDSPDRLVSEDTNDVRDVYLWDRDAAPGGQLQLLTSGQDDKPSWALDLDPTGRNAFFTTGDGLVAADDNDGYDVYVARMGGGFPESRESCVGEECRSPDIAEPPVRSIASNVLTTVSTGPRRPVQAGTSKLRVRSVRSSPKRLTVRIDTPEAGRIRVSGKYVRTASRTAKRSTTYTVRVSLSQKARRRVAEGKTVKVMLRVQFTPRGSKRSSRVSSSVSIRKGR